LLIRANKVFRAGAWSDVATDTVVLDRESRHRRRKLMTGEGGLDFMLDLPEAVQLRDGDGLLLSDGRIVRVKAAPEPVVDITASAETLVRIAWHLGNRHLPTQLFADRLRVRRDPVIEALAVRLGGTVTALETGFDPEGGAYDDDGGHDHAGQHDHGAHDHDHDHDHHHHDHGPHGHDHDH